MDKIYFSKQNIIDITGHLQKRFLQSSNIDIGKDERYMREISNIMKTVYSHRGSFNFPKNMSNQEESRQLSLKAIQVATNYINDIVSKTQSKTNVINRQQQLGQQPAQQHVLSSRPTSTSSSYITHGSVQNNYDQIMKDRDMVAKQSQFKQANFNDPAYNVNTTNDDVNRRFMEIQNSRKDDYSQQQSISNQNSYFDTTVNQPQQNSILEQQFLQSQVNNPNSQIQSYNSRTGTYLQQETQVNKNAIPNSNMGSIQFGDSYKSNEIVMESDPVNYDDLYSSMNNNLQSIFNNEQNRQDSFQVQFANPIVNLNPSNNERENQLEKIFPNTPFDNSIQSSGPTKSNNNFSINSEIDTIKSYIDRQQSVLLETNNKLGLLIDTLAKQDISKYYNTIMDIPRLIQAQQKQPLTIRTHNLIISSKDRDLTNLEFDKYSFRVVFGAEGDYTSNQFNNTNNNIGTSSVASGQKTFVSSGLKNPSIQQVLRNVTSIKLSRVIIPKPRDSVFYPEPYFFVAVDEFNSNIISTKTFSEKLFCKVHYDKEVQFNTGSDSRSYLYYINNDDDFTMFYSSPLGKLDRLTLKLLDSNGQSVKELYNDIDFVTTDGFGTTSEQFYNSTFPGDRLLQDNSNRYIVQSIDSVSKVIQTKPIHTNSVAVPGNKFLVNLSNQIEYVFEIKTTEPDSTGEIRPTIN
jgi:hypothetical protein